MKHILISHLEHAFSLTTDIAHEIGESQYKEKLGAVKSNSFGEQLCCVLGARESYLKQLQEKNNFEFKCSVQDTSNKFQIMQGLHQSAEQIVQYTKENPTDEVAGEILFTILEHEVQHHGQLIRYVYGNNWDFPESWKQHYTV